MWLEADTNQMRLVDVFYFKTSASQIIYSIDHKNQV